MVRRMDEPNLKVEFRVVAYDESGYGDNRSKEFTNGKEAVDYARSLPANFGASVWKTITMAPIHIRIPID